MVEPCLGADADEKRIIVGVLAARKNYVGSRKQAIGLLQSGQPMSRAAKPSAEPRNAFGATLAAASGTAFSPTGAGNFVRF